MLTLRTLFTRKTLFQTRQAVILYSALLTTGHR
jgi:hypothetical protein